MLATYLTTIVNIKESDKEVTYRGALEKLFKDMLESLGIADISVIHEPNNDKEGRGAPDFLIKQDDLSIGYIENKRVNADLGKLIDEANNDSKAQIAKYLTLSENLILTDYLRFLKVAKNDKGKIVVIKEVRICELSELPQFVKLASKTQKATNPTKAQNLIPNTQDSTLISKQNELLEFFTLFFSATPKSLDSA